MTDYDYSLGIPSAGKVEGISDHRRPDQQEQQKKEKKDRQERKSLLSGQDEIVLSAEAEEQAHRVPHTVPKETSAPEDKGAFIDVKA